MKGTKWFNNCYSKKESISINGTGRESWINITEVCSWWGYTQERSIHQSICWVTEIISASDWSKSSVNRNLGWNVPLTAFLKVQRLFISASGSQLTSWCGWACPAWAPQSPQWVPRALPELPGVGLLVHDASKWDGAQWLESAPLQLRFTAAVTACQERGNWVPWMYNVPLREQLCVCRAGKEYGNSNFAKHCDECGF